MATDGHLPSADRYDWSPLNHLQVGRYGEYLAKMEFALHGFDVYTAEIDDKGIDFVVRSPTGEFHEIQVKAVRWPRGDYVFMRKDCFIPKPTLHLVLLILKQFEAPLVYLLPSRTWHDPQRPACLVQHEYGGELKSSPEYGINVSLRAMNDLEPFRLERQIHVLRGERLGDGAV